MAKRVRATKICEIYANCPDSDDVVPKGNALTFVQNEKTIDLPDILAQCLRILAPTSGILWILISRERLFWITMDFRGPKRGRFVMGFWGVPFEPWDPPFSGASDRRALVAPTPLRLPASGFRPEGTTFELG